MLLFCFLLVVLAVGYLLAPSTRLPPGPRALPVIGNVHQLAKRYPWKQFQQWHKTYGPLFTVRAGQMTLVILGNHKVARELLGRRSLIYSSRPRLVVAQECLAKGFGSALLPYGPAWKHNHKMQMSLLSPRRCQLYRPLQELESRQLLFNLLSTHDFGHETHRYSSSLLFALLYGKRLVTGQEPELKQIESLAGEIVGAVSFGNWLVDIFPLLNWLPQSLAKWKQVGDEYHQRQARLYEKNAASALETSCWNWTKQGFRESEESLGQEKPLSTRKELNFVLGEIFEAGSHTTAGALCVAVLACVSYPETMRRVHEELDARVGSDRLPTFDDFPLLPYTRAFVEEVLRWRPLAPGGVPHSPVVDDSYGGYSIPKGTAVVANHWSLDMDEEVFRDPQDFVPERWVGEPDLPLAAFGFGRRTCPGQHLARSSLLLVVARLLWAYDIAWKEGQEQRLDSLEMTHEGIFSKPCPFEATFTVRSSRHEKVVRDDWLNSDTRLEPILEAAGAAFSEQ